MTWVEFGRKQGRPRGARDKRPRKRQGSGIGGHAVLVAAPVAGGFAGGELTRQGISRYHPTVRQAKNLIRQGSLKTYTEANMNLLAHGVDLGEARRQGQQASKTYRELSNPTIKAARVAATITPKARLAIGSGAIAGSLVASHAYRKWRKRSKK